MYGEAKHDDTPRADRWCLPLWGLFVRDKSGIPFLRELAGDPQAGWFIRRRKYLEWQYGAGAVVVVGPREG